MQQWILEHQEFVQFIVISLIGFVMYQVGHHEGYVKGFRCGRRAGIKHPTNGVVR